MNIALLHSDSTTSEHFDHLRQFLLKWGVVQLFSQKHLELKGMDYLVSYGYRHIIREDVLALFPHRAMNLHISLLPWNRGADPNFWSFYDNTPKGVTLHLLDKGVDTGDIIAQKVVPLEGPLTLKSSYNILQTEIIDLFKTTWPKYIKGELAPRPQLGPGTLHRKKDLDQVLYLLDEGWDTSVHKICKELKP